MWTHNSLIYINKTLFNLWNSLHVNLKCPSFMQVWCIYIAWGYTVKWSECSTCGRKDPRVMHLIFIVKWRYNKTHLICLSLPRSNGYLLKKKWLCIGIELLVMMRAELFTGLRIYYESEILFQGYHNNMEVHYRACDGHQPGKKVKSEEHMYFYDGYQDPEQMPLPLHSDYSTGRSQGDTWEIMVMYQSGFLCPLVCPMFHHYQN